MTKQSIQVSSRQQTDIQQTDNIIYQIENKQKRVSRQRDDIGTVCTQQRQHEDRQERKQAYRHKADSIQIVNRLQRAKQTADSCQEYTKQIDTRQTDIRPGLGIYQADREREREKQRARQTHTDQKRPGIGSCDRAPEYEYIIIIHNYNYFFEMKKLHRNNIKET